jgi:hypothetical protein
MDPDPDADPDPAVFIIVQIVLYGSFPAYYFLKTLLYYFSKIKSQKKSQNSRNQGFSYYFCMIREGSGSGSIPLTNGSGAGSRRPKNIRIRRIRIRIRDTTYSK